MLKRDEKTQKCDQIVSRKRKKTKKQYYVETGEFSKKDLKEWRKAVNIGVQKYHRPNEKMK